MRGLMPGVASPHPLSTALPALLQEDEFATGFVGGLDEVLSPLLSTLDCLDAYVDASLTPEDFLSWLGGWLGVGLDETWPLQRRRAFVAQAVDLYRRRGTVDGLRAHLELVTGGTVEIAETGGVAWSQTSGGPLPGEAHPRMSVRVRVDDPAAVDERALDALVAAAKPAHVVHRVEVTGP